MHWKVYNKVKPLNGTSCIVGRVIDGRPGFAVYTYYGGVDPHWISGHGKSITIQEYDHWCDVEDVVSYIGDKLEYEISAAMFREG